MAEVVFIKNRQDLERLEGIITRNLQSFYEVGLALMEIRDRNLHQDVLGFETFEEYCKAKWDFTSNYARRLIGSAETIDNIKNVPIGTLPATESQTRPLSRLEPEKQREAWREAVETAPEGKVTAAHVNKVVKKYRLEGAVGTVEKTGAEKAEPEGDLPDDGLKLCDKAIAQMAKIHKTDIYREKAFDRMQAWLNENRLPTADKMQKNRALRGEFAKGSVGKFEQSPVELALPLPLDEPIKTNLDAQGEHTTNEGIASGDVEHHEPARDLSDIDVRKRETYRQSSLAFE